MLKKCGIEVGPTSLALALQQPDIGSTFLAVQVPVAVSGYQHIIPRPTGKMLMGNIIIHIYFISTFNTTFLRLNVSSITYIYTYLHIQI